MLLWLLIVPVLIGLFGLIVSKGKVTLKEFLVQEGVVIIFIVIGYNIALHGATSDTEIWNGVIAKKWEGSGSCCHSYQCNPHSCNCDSKGNNCSTCYDTCYEHSSDTTWNASTSNGETAYYDGCNAPGSSPPGRYESIIIGEPTAIEHSYTNYIKGNPDTLLRRNGQAERFKGKIPTYPSVYDDYRVHHFLAIGVNVPDAELNNARLSEINAVLGHPKQVNITIIIVNESDASYVEGLREAWIGGKKNDLVVVIGTPAFPKIAWVSVMSWTKNEDVKISIRNRLVTLPAFDGTQVMNIIGEEVRTNFVRRQMREFEYLLATLEPPAWVCWLLFILGCLSSIGLTIAFWMFDPFGDSVNPRYRYLSSF